jgi:hypothetical protein
MAVYQLNTEDTWLPTFARGKGLACTKIRVRKSDGTTEEIVLAGNKQTGEITDPRVIRHMDSDPRFTRVS